MFNLMLIYKNSLQLNVYCYSLYVNVSKSNFKKFACIPFLFKYKLYYLQLVIDATKLYILIIVKVINSCKR